ncbi:MAG: hypothetical protein E7J44_16760 [Citrobacter freundii]|nr:hypothetical protein [Citrobacter freundii]
MLFSIFIRDGKNFYCAPSRSTDTRSAPYVCGTFHDVRREHPCAAKNPGPSRHKNDYALCSPCTGSP